MLNYFMYDLFFKLISIYHGEFATYEKLTAEFGKFDQI